MESIVFYDVRKPPFSIHGLYEPQTQPTFRRVPADVAASVSERVAIRANQPSGGRVRFTTDSDVLVLRVHTGRKEQDFHVSPMLESGVDVYMNTARGPRFVSSMRPPWTRNQCPSCFRFLIAKGKRTQ